MKKVRKISVVLTFIGILMIGSACLLEYIAFQEKPIVETKQHEKVTLKDMLEAKRNKNEKTETEKEKLAEEVVLARYPEVEVETPQEDTEKIVDVTAPIVEPVVFENMTLSQLGEKLERSLNSDIKGYGNLIATHSMELGLDPYLTLAIILHETGCKWNCSTLVKTCNNVGGQKGGPSCNGGAYKAYNTLEEGIIGYMDNLYLNYYSKGLTTPEAIGPKYAGSSDWASKIQSYIKLIRET